MEPSTGGARDRRSWAWATVPLVLASFAGSAAFLPPPRTGDRPAELQAASDTLTRSDLLDRWARSYRPGRSGDVMLVPAQGEILTDQDPDYRYMHGSPWSYDARVPMILAGEGRVRPGSRSRAASHEDLGATVAALLGLPPPPGADGRVLDAFLRSDDAAALPEPGPPRIVAVLLLDAFRADYLQRYADSLPALRRLRSEGAAFPGRVSYLPTATAVAHSTFSAAATPSRHGITGNTLYDRRSGAAANAYDGASPRNFLGLGLADRWQAETAGRSVVAVQGGTYYPAVALAGKGACVAGGRRHRVGFYDAGTGRWRTNSRCYRLPPGLTALRAAEGWAEAGGRWLGHDVANPDDFRRSALFARFEGRASRRVLEELAFGRDDVADLLLLNWKAGDYVGHAYGPDAPETLATLAEVDRQVGLLVDALDDAAGPRGWVLAVTADHGMPADLPESRERRRYADVLRAVDGRFDPDGPGVALHLGGADLQLFVDRERLRELGVGVDEVADFVEGLPWVRAAFSEAEVGARARR